eukprot:jgi/Mesvir1/21989/Mv04525-RA.1
MYLFEGIFDDPMCFWPFVPGATLEERCVAAKRFGVYVMIVGGAVMWSVRAVIFGFAIAVLSHIAFCVDSCIMERKERGKRFETGDKTNPYANYTVGRDVTEVYGSAPSAKMRTTFQSVVEDPHSTDVTRFLSVPRQDLMQRIRISGFRSDMVTFFTAAEFMKKLVKGGDYSAFDKEIKSSESAALKGSLPDPKSMWRRNKAGDLEIVPPLVRSPEMVHTFWQFLPTKNDRMVKSGVTNRKTIQNLISNDSTLATLEKQIEFLVRLAAHDFVLLEFIRKHNYHLDRNTFGDDIATAQEDVFLPPGVKTKIETPMLRLGSEAIPTIPKACRTVEETNANMLVLPDKHGTRDDDQDIKTRSYMMVEKLVELFKDSTVERNVVPVMLPKPEDQIETVANPTDANVVVPPRRSCMGMFVDGKYPDPSKHRTRPVGTDKPDEYRDYTRAKPFDDEYPGKEFRKDMDVKVPVTKTCEKSLQDETPGSKRAIEIEQHTEPVRGEKDEILACRQRSARTYEKREKVMFLPFQSTQWRVGIVAEAPSDQSSKHNPWVKIFYEENGKHVTKPITINRIRPFSSTAAATQKRVQEAREESEAKRLEFVQRRREARNQQADNMSDFRQRAMAFENDPGEKERRKRMVAALVAKNGKQDPQDAYMDKKAKSISNDTLVTLPNVFSAMLTVR